MLLASRTVSFPSKDVDTRPNYPVSLCLQLSLMVHIISLPLFCRKYSRLGKTLMVHDQCLLLFLRIARAKSLCDFATSTYLWACIVGTNQIEYKPPLCFRLKVVCEMGGWGYYREWNLVNSQLLTPRELQQQKSDILQKEVLGLLQAAEITKRCLRQATRSSIQQSMHIFNYRCLWMLITTKLGMHSELDQHYVTPTFIDVVFHTSVSNYAWLALFPGGLETRLIIDGAL